MPAISPAFDLPPTTTIDYVTPWGQTAVPPFAFASVRLASPGTSIEYLPDVHVEKMTYDAAAAKWVARIRNDGAAIVGAKLALLP